MTHPYYITWTKQKDALSFEVEKAEGAEFILPGGRRVADMVSTSFQASFGHSFGPIRDAIIVQIAQMPIASPKAEYALKNSVTKDLIKFLGFDGGKIFYTLSGAESVENALKIARQIKQRKIVVSRTDSYHGATLGALSVTGDWRRAPHFTVDDWNLRIPSPVDDPEFKEARRLIESAGPQNIAAMIFETVSGTNGVITGGESWWNGVREVCREHGIFLICDEVLAGFYRTGKPFAFHHFGLKPDMVCLAKAISGGYFPLGAVYTSSEISSYYEDEILSCGLTNYAIPSGLAALRAVLNALREDKFLAGIKNLEKVFSEGLAELKNDPAVKALRQWGLLACLDLQKNIPAKKFLEKDLYVTTTEKRLFLAPAFVMGEKALVRNFERIKKVVTS